DVVKGAAALGDPASLPGRAPDPVVDVVRRAVRNRLLDGVPHLGPVLEDDRVVERDVARDVTFARLAGEDLDAHAHVLDLPRPVDARAEDRPGDVLDQGAEVVATLLERRRRLAHPSTMARVHVEHDEEEEAEGQSAVEDGAWLFVET